MKAFDKVPHLRLIHKLEKYQITGQFSGWIRSFLLGRKQRVIVNGEKVLDHYENPRNVGVLDKDAKNVGTGMVGAPACGDVKECANSSLKPSARNTYDGSRLAEVHAEPEETAISLIAIISDSPST
jgi:hypothetical protein